MHKIDTEGSTADGLFQEGNPQTGQIPTRVSADWLNAIQTEILNVLSAAGVAPNKSSNAQLRTAIQSLITTSTLTAAQILAKFLTVDGSGSGVDADLLDGQHGSYYAPIASPTFSGTVAAPTITADNGAAQSILRLKSTGQNAAAVSDLQFYRDGTPKWVWRHGTSGALSLLRDVADSLSSLTLTIAPDTGLINFGTRPTFAGTVPWDAANDGAGSGLDADRLDGQEGSYYANIPARLGYTPVRQGTGIGQLGNIVHIGWKPNATVGITVDAVDQGYIIMDKHYTGASVLSRLLTVDGSGSGLDADLLDGQHGSYYAPIASPTFSGTVAAPTITADNGAAQSILRLKSTGQNAAAVSDLQFYRDGTPKWVWRHGTSGALSLLRDVAGTLSSLPLTIAPDTGLINFGTRPTFAGTVPWDAANDGSGSGLDADRLDGQEGSYYSNIIARLGYTPVSTANYTASDVLAKLRTVDGAGSGIDADTLDGYQASDFLNLINGLMSAGSNANGHIMRLGPWVIQMGIRFAAPADDTTIVTFPEPFARAPHWYMVGPRRSSYVRTTDAYAEVIGTPTATQMTVANNNISGNPIIDIMWIAIAYAA